LKLSSEVDKGNTITRPPRSPDSTPWASSLGDTKMSLFKFRQLLPTTWLRLSAA